MQAVLPCLVTGVTGLGERVKWVARSQAADVVHRAMQQPLENRIFHGVEWDRSHDVKPNKL